MGRGAPGLVSLAGRSSASGEGRTLCPDTPDAKALQEIVQTNAEGYVEDHHMHDPTPELKAVRT